MFGMVAAMIPLAIEAAKQADERKRAQLATLLEATPEDQRGAVEAQFWIDERRHNERMRARRDADRFSSPSDSGSSMLMAGTVGYLIGSSGD